MKSWQEIISNPFKIVEENIGLKLKVSRIFIAIISNVFKHKSNNKADHV